jgi:hypothetical protein
MVFLLYLALASRPISSECSRATKRNAASTAACGVAVPAAFIACFINLSH